MIYGDVCTGISAASVAWHGLDWRAAFFAEIDKAPSAVLKHHYPTVKNYGDFTKIGSEAGPIDVLVGGTPCQSFSVAGLRGGMGDERGNLSLEFLRLADRLRPRWIVWENVPGIFSSLSHDAPDPCMPPPPLDLECDGQEVDTEDEYDSEELHGLNCFLAGLSELRYGFAYGVLDAQHFGVPQRRRRIFVVGHLGDWRGPAAVLFDATCLQGNPAPSREAGKDIAPTISARTKGCGGLGTDFDLDGGLIAGTLNAGGHSRNPLDEPLVATRRVVFRKAMRPHSAEEAERWEQDDLAGTLNGWEERHDPPPHIVTHTLRGEGFDASEDGTGRGIPLVPIAFQERGRDGGRSLDLQADLAYSLNAPAGGGRRQELNVCIPILEAGARTGKSTDDIRAGIGIGEPGDPMFTLQSGKQHAVAFNLRGREGGSQPEVSDVASLRAASGGSSRSYVAASAVRRLTPTECEALQGFPRDYTLVPYRGKLMADGPRYKMLGNSFAVPVVRWIGERIAMVDAILRRSD